MNTHRVLADPIIVSTWLTTGTRSRFLAKRCGTTHQAIHGVLKRHIPQEERHAARRIKLRPQRHYRGERSSQRAARRYAAERFYALRILPRMSGAEPTTAERSEPYWKRKPAVLLKAKAHRNIASFLARINREVADA